MERYEKFFNVSDFEKNLKIPNFQRNIDMKVIDKIVEYIYEACVRQKHPALGCLELCQIKGPIKTLYLIDGQHRYAAIKKLYEEKHTIIPINALIYTVNDFEEMKSLFTVRNLGTPMPFYYLESDVSEHIDLIKEIETVMNGIPVFKSGTANRPYTSKTSFLSAFLNSDFYKNNHIKSREDFIQLLHYINNYSFNIVTKMDEKVRKRKGISEKMMKVWSDCGWYFPYDANYPYFNSDNITDFLNFMNSE